MDFTIRLVGPKDNFPDLENEKWFRSESIKRGHVYLLNIKYDASLIRTHGFAVSYKSSRRYTELSNVQNHIKKCSTATYCFVQKEHRYLSVQDLKELPNISKNATP